METPSSARRTTRSQALIQNAERSALGDITNDSPIVGLAAGTLKTPLSSSAAENKGWKGGKTPGSGEAILRGQVKTLLQKVEEESVLEVGRGAHYLRLMAHLRSPAGLLAPTPANTPQIDGSVEGEQKSDLSQEPDLSVCVLNRALQFDSTDESDRSSIWSLQAHDGSSQKNESDWTDNDDDKEDDDHGDVVVDRDDDIEGDDDDDLGIADLCHEMESMGMMNKRDVAAEFVGRHIRFTYNSDGEIDGEEQVSPAVSPNAVLLRGMPVPEGKHLRFQDDDDEL